MILHFVGLHIVDVINEWKVLQLPEMSDARSKYKVEEEVRRSSETVLPDS
jgi:hypothetical protein